MWVFHNQASNLLFVKTSGLSWFFNAFLAFAYWPSVSIKKKKKNLRIIFLLPRPNTLSVLGKLSPKDTPRRLDPSYQSSPHCRRNGVQICTLSLSSSSELQPESIQAHLQPGEEDPPVRSAKLRVAAICSTNDARVLRRSTLYHLANNGGLFDHNLGIEGFAPYLLGDSGYPLLPWLMVPHRNPNPTVLESLYNRKLRRGRGVVENAFGILKETWRELLGKTELNVKFLPDVITCCALLHNALLSQGEEDVERLLNVIDNHELGDGGSDSDDGEVYERGPDDPRVGNERTRGDTMRRSLGIF